MAAGGATLAATVITAAPASADGVWDRVARCESGGNWSVATGNGYYGGLQFSVGSWRAAGGSRYASTPHQASRAEQIAVAQNLLRMQGPGAWPVCSRKAGLNRANGLSGAVTASAKASSTASYVNSARSVRSLKGYAGRAQVRDLQTWAGVSRDGKWGAKTTRALQRKVGARATGHIDVATVRTVESLLGVKKTGLSYLNKPTMNKLMAYAAR